MIHDVIVVDGKEYKAVSPINWGSCLGCAFAGEVCGHIESSCWEEDRPDNQDVIFKPHYKLSNKNG